MNNKLILSAIIIALWVTFVIYCLFNGSKLLVQTKYLKSIYWILTAFAVDVILYFVNGLSIASIVLMIIMLLVTCLYISIPSGYGTKGIYIRGMLFPYKKIEDMKIENILRTNRLNFKCFYCIFYIDSDSYKELKDCEILYKKERYHD